MKKSMNRREFLKAAGLSAAAVGVFGTMSGCKEGEEVKQEGMTYRMHRRYYDNVSLLGYGCMRLPLTKDADGNEIVDQEMTNELFDHALKHGVNYFDTAPVYHNGDSERVTGEALFRHPRDKYFIATKLSNFKDYSREASMEMYHKSFWELRTEYIDYYLLHSIGSEADFNKRFLENGMIDFLLEERKTGKIRNLGFSFHGRQKGFDELLALHEKYHWDFVQIQMNYVDWTHASSRGTDAKYLMEALAEKGIPAIIMEPLLGGSLAKLPTHIANRLKERDPKQSIASWAFRFAGTPENVLCVLSGMTYMEHLQDNINTYSPLKPLDSKDLDFLEETAELMKEYPTINCTGCRYCMPCPYGIDIPAILRHYNKCVNEGYIAESGSENYRKARRAYLVSYDRKVHKLNQADRCIGCNKCIQHCPQGISIPFELRRIDKYIEGLKRNKF